MRIRNLAEEGRNPSSCDETAAVEKHGERPLTDAGEVENRKRKRL